MEDKVTRKRIKGARADAYKITSGIPTGVELEHKQRSNSKLTQHGDLGFYDADNMMTNEPPIAVGAVVYSEGDDGRLDTDNMIDARYDRGQAYVP